MGASASIPTTEAAAKEAGYTDEQIAEYVLAIPHHLPNHSPNGRSATTIAATCDTTKTIIITTTARAIST